MQLAVLDHNAHIDRAQYKNRSGDEVYYRKYRKASKSWDKWMMKGARNEVAKQLSDEENRAVYIHCYGHALNLAAAESIKNLKIMKDATYEIS